MSDSSPISGLAELYLFPYYATHELYRLGTGQDAPSYNPFKPRKYWFDPAANDTTKRYMIYDHAVVTDTDGYSAAQGFNKKPYSDQLIVLREDAATVNIPIDRLHPAGEVVVIPPEIQVPIRALKPGEELAFGIGGSVVCSRPDIVEQANGGFTRADRQLLQAIADHVGAK
ncbi:MAG: hypothetical protein ABI693_23480 [Bryobacteraceae bacterium]